MELTNINIKVEMTENGIGNIVIESKTRELLNGTKFIGESKTNNYYGNKHSQLFIERKSTGEVRQHTPGVNACGYPIIKVNGKTEYLHKLVVQAFIAKEIPKGSQVDHVSGVKSDFSVSNLRIVTPQQNMRYAFSNRLIKTRKLTHSQVETIKYLYGTGQASQNELAEEFGVSQQNISRVVNDKTYQF